MAGLVLIVALCIVYNILIEITETNNLPDVKSADNIKSTAAVKFIDFTTRFIDYNCWTVADI